MNIKSLLSGVSVACLLTVSAYAVEPLQPRAEVSVKGGTDRSLLTTEFWAPLAQDNNRVLYGDIRLMGDNDENREGNLGIGYRQIKDNAVLGAHGWIDRRRTQNNSTFHQLTFGVERLGHIVDARANVYIPLNGNRSIVTPNIGSATPYLAGSGIFYDTNGMISETPQYGLDGEMGIRIPIFQRQVDALRILGGGYHFFRDQTDNVTGIRVRTEAQINSAFSIGARFQHDEPRGSQGFLEATLKFPFSAKKLYQTDYLRSRLDESPERDVDIVTDAKVDTGLRKEIISTTSGQRQRVINVDNSNINAGDGTKENPFNTLKAAEAILQDNDIIYVNHGTGTTQGMDLGIVIGKANVQLIGSGSNFVYDAGKFSSYSSIKPTTGTLIAAATAAPNITNTEVNGSGINITGNNALVTGLTISGVEAHGISFSNAIDEVSDSLTITNNTIFDAGNAGTFRVGIRVQNNGKMNTVLVENNIIQDVQSSGGRGIQIQAAENSALETTIIRGNIIDDVSAIGIIASVNAANSYIGNVFIENNNVNDAATHALRYGALNDGRIGSISISNNIATLSSYGIFGEVRSNGSVDNLTISNNQLDRNGGGIITQVGVASAIGKITNATIANNTVTNGTSANLGRADITVSVDNADAEITSLSILNNNLSNGNNIGIDIRATSGAAKISDLNITDNLIDTSASYGMYVLATNAVMATTNITGNTVLDAGSDGIYVRANGATARFDNLKISDNTSTDNSRGIVVSAATSAIINSMDVTDNTTTYNTGNGIELATGSSAIVSDVAFERNISTNNGTSGLYVTPNSSTINGMVIQDNRFNSNSTHGLHIYAASTSAVLTGVTISGNDMIGNSGNGLFVRKANVATVTVIDAGNGSLGSAGLNRIFGNTGNDLNVDRIPGFAAGMNWWNNGGAAPTRVTTVNGGSAVYTTPLASDPRP